MCLARACHFRILLLPTPIPTPVYVYVKKAGIPNLGWETCLLHTKKGVGT